jgi:hypothetical protein
MCNIKTPLVRKPAATTKPTEKSLADKYDLMADMDCEMKFECRLLFNKIKAVLDGIPSIPKFVGARCEWEHLLYVLQVNTPYIGIRALLIALTYTGSETYRAYSAETKKMLAEILREFGFIIDEIGAADQ